MRHWLEWLWQVYHLCGTAPMYNNSLSWSMPCCCFRFTYYSSIYFYIQSGMLRLQTSLLSVEDWEFWCPSQRQYRTKYTSVRVALKAALSVMLSRPKASCMQWYRASYCGCPSKDNGLVVLVLSSFMPATSSYFSSRLRWVAAILDCI